MHLIDGNSLLKTDKSYHDINSIMITFDQEISNEEIPRKNEDITMRIIIRQTSRLRYTKKFSLFEIAPSLTDHRKVAQKTDAPRRAGSHRGARADL